MVKAATSAKSSNVPLLRACVQETSDQTEGENRRKNRGTEHMDQNALVIVSSEKDQ